MLCVQFDFLDPPEMTVYGIKHDQGSDEHRLEQIKKAVHEAMGTKFPTLKDVVTEAIADVRDRQARIAAGLSPVKHRKQVLRHEHLSLLDHYVTPSAASPILAPVPNHFHFSDTQGAHSGLHLAPARIAQSSQHEITGRIEEMPAPDAFSLPSRVLEKNYLPSTFFGEKVETAKPSDQLRSLGYTSLSDVRVKQSRPPSAQLVNLSGPANGAPPP